MLPRVKLYLAIALGLFVVSLTDVAVTAQDPTPSASRPIVSPLIAFRPYSKNVTTSWWGVPAAEAADEAAPKIYADVYESGKARYDYDSEKKILTGKPGADGDGEKIVFDKQVEVVFQTGTPPPTDSADTIWPLYLTHEKQRPCWHLNDDSLSFKTDTSIEHKVRGKLIKSSTLSTCS